MIKSLTKKSSTVLARGLPEHLTSYDLLKSLAVFLMILDHVGAYFYPEELWFRVFGRLCVPIWFFLIGYARTREVPRLLWFGGGVLVLSAMISGGHVFPISILFGFIALRFWIDPIMVRALRTAETLAGMFFIFMLLSLHSSALVEYGTLGALFAMFGYMRRHKDEVLLDFRWQILFFVAVFIAFLAHQSFMLPGLSVFQFWVFVGGLVAVFLILFGFKPRVYSGASVYFKTILPVFYVLGRWTLEVYVIHLLFFRGLAMVFSPDRFVFLSFEWMPAGLAQLFMT